MATSKQGWPTQKEAAKAARGLRRVGYKARVSRRKIKGFYRIIYSEVGKVAMAKRKPKYPNRIYGTKASAQRASDRYGGKGVKKVEVARKAGRMLKGWGIKW